LHITIRHSKKTCIIILLILSARPLFACQQKRSSTRKFKEEATRGSNDRRDKSKQYALSSGQH
jgi:hypothetical protein